jgi:hypothetical protein
MIAVISSLLMLFTLTACKANEDTFATQESTTIFNNIVNENITEDVFYTETITLNNTENYTQDSPQIIPSDTTCVSSETAVTTSVVFDDPGNWSKEKIVDEYKKAAVKSSLTAKSTQKITMKELSVNDGEQEKMMSFIKSIIAKFLESNSTQKNGITGGYENLVSQDVKSATAYKSDDDIVIEMIMVEQVSGAKEDANSGSVGHAITTVGDITEVVKELDKMGLSLELSEEDTKIYYTNPVVRVNINDNGEIISGTWSCTVEISMNNFNAFGKDVDNATIVMENVINV